MRVDLGKAVKSEIQVTKLQGAECKDFVLDEPSYDAFLKLNT